MRIDLALKYLCLAKSRSSVRTLCDKLAITLNDKPAKPSSTVRVDDTIAIGLPSRTLTVRLISVPEKQLSKAVAPAYYEVVD